MENLIDFNIEWKPTLTEELSFKACCGVEDKKNNGMFCIVCDGSGEEWFYSDDETSLEI